jgi:hypothetical protein
VTAEVNFEVDFEVDFEVARLSSERSRVLRVVG